ncbi:MAG: hypothetical protein ACREQK_02285 [Candidatus Binatia bacterium]
MAPIFSFSDEQTSPEMILTGLYRQAFNLAEQIRVHADQAPYAHIASQLREMAVKKQKNVEVLRDRLVSLGAEVQRFQPGIQSGRNHWERMTKDLETQKAFEGALRDHASLLAERAPELSRLLIGIANSERPHKETLFQFVMRADPQASLS